ncbi:apolipoprotein N-acyltransferase [Streptomyces albulus]|nr:apolipoprotein N-acyltransferase [Streptomyces noursei]
MPPALRLASLGGVWLVSLLIVAVNTALAGLLAVPTARRPPSRDCWCARWPVPRSGCGRRSPARRHGADRGRPAGSDRHPTQRLARSAALTAALAGRGCAWSCGARAASTRTRGPPGARRPLAALSRRTGADLLVNADAPGSDGAGIAKSAVLIGPDGPTGDRYAKMRLVPFGEYIPARSVLGWATKVGKAATSDRRRGTHQVVMAVPTAAGLRIGPLVCFETAFPDMSRHLAADGAQVLVAQSSTATFQDSWAPAQHASLGALRAAETWRPMVHATLTGVSAAYGPRGEPLGTRLSTDRSAAAVYDLPLASGTSPYTRWGDWSVYGAIAALLAYGLTEAGRSCGRRRADRSRGAEEDTGQEAGAGRR